MRVKLCDVTSYSKGIQINGDELVDDGKYYYINGGINPSGKWNSYNVDGNTITISEGGNSSGYINYIDEPFWCGAHCYYLYDGPKNTRYLYYALKSQQERMFDIRSGACMPNIKKSDLGNFEFEFEQDEQKQENITSILFTVETIIQVYNKELKFLKELVKARFVEMFGNPISNDKEWKQKPLAYITKKIGSGATPKGGKDTYQEEGITLVRSMNVHNGKFEYKDLAHISEEQAAKLDNVIIEENDVLINITGASVARSCVVPNEILPARVNQHVCIVRCKECILPEFLNNLLIDDNFQNLLWSIAGGGATREAITKQQIENLQIILPPMELQQSFVEFVKQVDKSREIIQKKIDTYQELFDKLMQEYFG